MLRMRSATGRREWQRVLWIGDAASREADGNKEARFLVERATASVLIERCVADLRSASQQCSLPQLSDAVAAARKLGGGGMSESWESIHDAQEAFANAEDRLGRLVAVDGAIKAARKASDDVALQVAIDEAAAVCVDMYIDMCIHMCIDMYTDMCVDICIGICIDMCINVCTDNRHVY